MALSVYITGRLTRPRRDQERERSSGKANLDARSLFFLLVVSIVLECEMMMMLRASTPFAYAKVDKVDADEARHLQAQYLIHKVLEESCCAPSAAARGRRRPTSAAAAFLARAGGGAKARQIGVRLRPLRLAARSVRLRLCRGLQRHLRSLRRLVRGSSKARQLGSP